MKNTLARPSFYRLLFYCLLLAFVVLKVPHLYHTFFWDESWVYAPAVTYMYQHGPSLMPDAIPVDFARGHPVLFHAMCAAWMHLFGAGKVSMHCFAFAVSLSLVVAMFETISRLFNTRVGFIAGLLLLFNVYFFVASSMVLTDIMLALFAYLSLYFYTKAKYVWAAVALTLLYYTKESGLVMSAVLFADIVIDFFFKKIPYRSLVPKALVLVLPLCIISLFFIIQKQVYGWYLYPSHTNIVHMDIEYTFRFIQKSMEVIFDVSYVYLNYLLSLVILAVLYIRTRRKPYLYMLAAMIFVYLHIVVFGHKDAIFYGFIILLIIALLWLLKAKLPVSPLQERFIKLTVGFSAAFVYFSSINFFEGRYLMPVIFLISAVLLAVFFDQLLVRLSLKLFLPLTLLLLATGICSLDKDNYEMSVYKHLEIQQWMVTYMEKNDFYNKNIAAFSFLARVHLQDPKTGFLKSERSFVNVTEHVDSNTQLIICDNIKPSEQHAAIKNDSSFRLIEQHHVGGIWTEIYERK